MSRIFYMLSALCARNRFRREKHLENWFLVLEGVSRRRGRVGGGLRRQMTSSDQGSGFPNRCAVIVTDCSRRNGSSSMRPAVVTSLS